LIFFFKFWESGKKSLEDFLSNREKWEKKMGIFSFLQYKSKLELRKINNGLKISYEFFSLFQIMIYREIKRRAQFFAEFLGKRIMKMQEKTRLNSQCLSNFLSESLWENDFKLLFWKRFYDHKIMFKKSCARGWKRIIDKIKIITICKKKTFNE